MFNNIPRRTPIQTYNRKLRRVMPEVYPSLFRMIFNINICHWNVLSLIYGFYGFQNIGESFQENNSNLLPFQVRHQARALRRAPRPAAEQPTLLPRPVRARAPGCSGGDSYVEKICMDWELVPCSIHMGVSKNNGTPKSSILIGFFSINHPFQIPLFLETSFYTYKFEWFVHNKIM